MLRRFEMFKHELFLQFKKCKKCIFKTKSWITTVQKNGKIASQAFEKHLLAVPYFDVTIGLFICSGRQLFFVT
jgi:hypothetical protein